MSLLNFDTSLPYTQLSPVYGLTVHLLGSYSPAALVYLFVASYYAHYRLDYHFIVHYSPANLSMVPYIIFYGWLHSTLWFSCIVPLHSFLWYHAFSCIISIYELYGPSTFCSMNLLEWKFWNQRFQFQIPNIIFPKLRNKCYWNLTSS